MASQSEKRLLSVREVQILDALADTLIPTTEKLPDIPSKLGISEKIIDALGYSHPNIRLAFRTGLRMLQWSALFYKAEGKTFTRMSPERRAQFVVWWQGRRLKGSQLLLRLLEVYIYSHYYSFEEVYRRLGYTLKVPSRKPSQVLYGSGLTSALSESVEVECDACVIGSGAGGAVIAKELAELGMKVVILEEGGRFDLNDYKGEAISRSKRMYRDGGISTTVGMPPILLPLGKAIGGTTIINSGTCFRTPDTVLQVWREKYGLVHYSAEELAPYYEKAEANIHVAPVPVEMIGGSGKVIARGFEKLNITSSPLLRNAKDCQGSSLCCFGCPTDAKQSVQLNYIPQALAAGARLYAQCRVDRLISRDGRISAVEAVSVLNPALRLTVRPRFVVSAAGSIGTPLLLMASRLARTSGRLGKHLTLHPAAKAMALFDEPIEGWKGVPQSYYSDFLKSEGITFEGVFTPPSISSTAILLHGLQHKRVMENYDRLAAFGFMTQETTRGRVRRMPNGEALITYSLNRNDLKRLVKGLSWLVRIFFAAGARTVYPCIHGLPEIHSEAELDEVFRRNLGRMDLDIAAFHPLGTARMGADPKKSVVDEFGKVYDAENLYICDGSVFPTNLGVNPQLTIMAFATRAAEHLAKS